MLALFVSLYSGVGELFQPSHQAVQEAWRIFLIIQILLVTAEKINRNHKKHKKAHPNKQKLNNDAKSSLVAPAMCE